MRACLLASAMRLIAQKGPAATSIDFAEQSAAAALRGLGLDAKSAERIACSPLKPVQILAEGLLTETSESPAPAAANATRNGVGRRKLS